MAGQRHDGEHIQEHTAIGKTLKRRGILAAAGAVVAGFVAQRASQPVGATSGGGPDGPLVMSSNFGNTPNRATTLTLFTTASGATFGYPALFGVDASVGGATNANLDGLYGTGKGTGVGVIGFTETTPSTSGLNATGNAAVYGLATNGRTGVVGQSDGGQGVHGQSTGGTGVYGATATGLYGVYGIAGSHQGAGGVVGVATVAGTIGFAGAAFAPATDAGYFTGNVSVFGNFGVSGSKFAVVKGSDGKYRGMYAVESPECWFEDFGTGTIVNGKAEVKLDPLFAQHVHTDSYHVFLTPHDAEHNLAVPARAGQSFGVQASPSADASAKGKKAADLSGTFSYRVVAKRNDIAGERLPIWEMPTPAFTKPDLPTAPALVPPSRPAGPGASDASSPVALIPAPAPTSAPTVGGSAAPGAPNPLPPSRP